MRSRSAAAGEPHTGCAPCPRTGGHAPCGRNPCLRNARLDQANLVQVYALRGTRHQEEQGSQGGNAKHGATPVVDGTAAQHSAECGQWDGPPAWRCLSRPARRPPPSVPGRDGPKPRDIAAGFVGRLGSHRPALRPAAQVRCGGSGQGCVSRSLARGAEQDGKRCRDEAATWFTSPVWGGSPKSLRRALGERLYLPKLRTAFARRPPPPRLAGGETNGKGSIRIAFAVAGRESACPSPSARPGIDRHGRIGTPEPDGHCLSKGATPDHQGCPPDHGRKPGRCGRRGGPARRFA